MSILGPGFLIAVAMISAASATAGEEQDRTLGLVLSAGVPRGTFLSAKATATLTHVLIVAVALFVGMLIANPIGNLGIPVANLLAATLNMVLIALVFGAMTLGLGAVTGDKRLTLAITGAVIAVSFIAANFLGLNESLVWLSKLNFWYPYVASTPLANGLDWGLAATMVALALGMGAMAFVAFSRRADLRG
nr:ABC transporter permease subunit [Flaviflexus huanghaiensis]